MAKKITLPHLPERRGDEIERATIKPKELPTWEPEMPPEWTNPVSEGSSLAEFKNALQRKYERRTKAISIINLAISITASITKIPELRMLMFGNTKTTTMAKKNVSEQIQKVLQADGWEALVWAAVALLGILSGYFEGEISYIAAGIAAGIKAGFQAYKARQQDDEKMPGKA